MGKTIGTAAWYGAEGDALRAAGWWYGGLGSAGIIACAPGESHEACIASLGGSTPPPPNIQPPAPQEITGTVRDQACGSCRKPATTVVSVPAPSSPAPTTPGAPVPVKRFCWVCLIVLLIIVKVVTDGRDTRR